VKCNKLLYRNWKKDTIQEEVEAIRSGNGWNIIREDSGEETSARQH